MTGFRPFVIRLDAKDCFRFCVDLTSLIALCRPCVGRICVRLSSYFYRVAATSRARGTEKGSRNTKSKIELRRYLGMTGLPASPSPFGLTNICTTAYVPDFHAVSEKDSSFMLLRLSLDWTHPWEGEGPWHIALAT